jgi:hypothetical protein
MSEESAKEREILMVMRKVLAAIVKDTAPEHKALQHPLSEQTIQDIRACFGLITAREKELAELAGRIATERSYFIDEAPAATTVSISSIGRIEGQKEK